MHKESIGEGIVDDPLYRSSLSSTEEVQANKLAADILMPLDKIRERVKYYTQTLGENSNDVLAKNLAEEFDVSLGSMRIRYA